MTDTSLSAQRSAQMVTTLVQLREALETARLPLDVPEVEPARKARAEMIDQLEDYVLPRLLQIDAPLLTVVGGSSGAGKSTLVNSLVGERVTETGVLRPTTRSPVLVHNPRDADWFDKARILPDLERTTRASADPGALQLVASEAIPAGLAVLDAPDIDSVEEQNRTLAAQLLGAADLWLFVTSAARYADQVPWEFLKQAAERSAAVAIVLDRTQPSAITEVSAHLARMLTARGLRDSPLFIVPEGEVDEQGLLPSTTVREIRAWLGSLAADAEARTGVVRQTLEGAIRSISRRAHLVADACAEQQQAVSRLHEDVERAYRQAETEIDQASADGTLLRGEVLARWQEFVGTGEFLRRVDAGVSRLRDRITALLKGAPPPSRNLGEALQSGAASLLTSEGQSAAAATVRHWRRLGGGAALVAAHPDLAQGSADLPDTIDRTVRDWQGYVLELVREEGKDKRTGARMLAFGVNGIAVVLMLVAFSQTGGLIGAEVGIAGGAAVLAQRLLEAVFGDQAVRSLAAKARTELIRRTGEVYAAERARFERLLDDVILDPEQPERLSAARAAVETAR
ncbi:MAG TPA: dynamin family protein [Segeticoccus sp.]|nr:dynamin family protein [Segeticoccus sp.]